MMLPTTTKGSEMSATKRSETKNGCWAQMKEILNANSRKHPKHLHRYLIISILHPEIEV